MLNEYFLDTGDILAGHLTDLFNGIFNSGKFPKMQSEFKNGDTTNVNNYRAITLVSCMAKLFTSIFNKRLCDWAENNDKLFESQFSFRKGKSTTDAVFILHSIIEHILNDNKTLFCAFIDLRKACDSVYRNGLWCKLYNCGINGKMLYDLCTNR